MRASASPVDDVARATLAALGRVVPPRVPGILFLSGGQSEEDATKHLAAMNRLADGSTVDALVFVRSGAATSCLKAWGGDPANVAVAQAALIRRAEANGKASFGEEA